MLEDAAQVPWHEHAQPSWNSKDTVRAALEALASASPETAQQAYSDMLYALGNNHAGTYFPVVLPVIPFLAEILRDGQLAARARTLDVLVDLLGSFEPESGYEIVETSSGPQLLERLLASEAAKLAALVEATAKRASSREEATLANELLSLLREAES